MTVEEGMMAERVSDAALRALSTCEFVDLLTMRRLTGLKVGPLIKGLTGELLAYRQDVRAWHEATDKGDLARILPAEAALRALVKGE